MFVCVCTCALRTTSQFCCVDSKDFCVFQFFILQSVSSATEVVKGIQFVRRVYNQCGAN